MAKIVVPHLTNSFVVIIQTNVDSLWKAFSEKRGMTVFQNFLLLETNLWSSFPKRRLLVLSKKLKQKLLWRLKRFLDSSFLVFKDLFLGFDLFIIAFLSSFS